MTLAEKVLALRGIPPFDRLGDNELLLVARAFGVRHYRAGQAVSVDDLPLERLHVVLDGALVRPGGEPTGTVVGAAALLLGRPLENLSASTEKGATCLVLSRSNLYTTVNECPALLLGLRDLWSADPALVS